MTHWIRAGLRICALTAVLVTMEAAHAFAQAQTPAEPRFQSWLQAEVAYEHLSYGYGLWRSATLSLGTERDDGRALYGSLQEANRFSLLDHQLMIGVRGRPARRLIATAEVEASPSHHVLHSWGLLGRVEINVGRGWGVAADVRHRHYASDDVDLGSLTIERYVAQYRFAYVMYVARLGTDATSVSQRAQGDFYYGRRVNSVSLTVSAGDEIEHVQPLGVLRTPVRAGAIAGRHSLSSRWFLSYDALVHEQGALYTRRRVNLGLGARF